MATQTKPQLMQAYNQIVKEYGGYRRKPWPELAKFIASLNGKLVLDIGAGTCSTTRDLLNKNKVIALDFSFESLKLAPRILKICADAIHLPFKQASFDAVIAIGVLHHLHQSEHAAALNEIKRVTNEKAFISVWKKTNQKEKLVRWGKHERYYYFFTEIELEKLASKTFKSFKIKKDVKNLFLETTA